MRKSRRGNCYNVVCALYHLLGGKASGWIPCTVKHEGDTHWYLEKRKTININGKPEVWYTEILDPTAAQFKTPPPYEKGRGRGFLTKKPSKKAKSLMEQLLWQ